MNFEPVKHKDIDELKEFQPDDWPDIIPVMKYYIDADFCHPIKYIVNEKILGIGTSIDFQKTVWLAHIIVHPEYRKQGIGYRIVNELTRTYGYGRVSSILLIASKDGEKLYTRVGFRKITDYLFYKRVKTWPGYEQSKYIVPYEDTHRDSLILLDKEISGEDRSPLLNDFIDKAYVYIYRNKIKGYYFPGLGEGTIIAKEKKAGIELMKYKYAQVDKVVIPAENKTAGEFLKKNGFALTSEGARMVLGSDIPWQPKKIFSRIGGNFG